VGFIFKGAGVWRLLCARAFLRAHRRRRDPLDPGRRDRGDDCSAAKQALDQAQQALSSATRDVDTRADAYAQCIAAKQVRREEAAFDAASAAKSKAAASYKAAATRRSSACQ